LKLRRKFGQFQANTGDDNAVIDVDFKTGQVRRLSYKITVR